LLTERVGIWLFNEDRTAIECIEQYELSANRHTAGGRLGINDYPTYFKALQGARNITVCDTFNDPITHEF